MDKQERNIRNVIAAYDWEYTKYLKRVKVAITNEELLPDIPDFPDFKTDDIRHLLKVIDKLREGKGNK
jgi:hypothetical protein